MVTTNPYGDIELAPRAMRALAHPVRLAILSRLQGYGPSTATALAPLVGATPSVTSWHLRHLAEHGLVRDADVEADGRQRWWEAAGTGFRFTPPADEAGRDAATLLSHVLFAQAEPLPRTWARETRAAARGRVASVRRAVQHHVHRHGRRAGRGRGRHRGAARSLRAAQGESREAVPDGRNVRMLRYVLPEAEVTS